MGKVAIRTKETNAFFLVEEMDNRKKQDTE
jgi:hypothetical protein